ncbi:hypothetical protein JXA88_18460 [Candidatus Fermentibacteria bacterium]|nr:hypothetical protein [Candidatus Fermentibacteria bacterium]
MVISDGHIAREAFTLLRLSPLLEPRRDEFAEAVSAAYATIEGFAAAHGWTHRMGVFFDRGVEVFESQAALWERIKTLHSLPRDLPVPTPGLAAALECRILVAVTPEEYASVAPEYGSTPDAYPRLLAHEIAHRLHIAIVGGDEDAMGPEWLYEGFAVVASGDLLEPPRCEPTWEALSAGGRGAYRRYAALVRRLMSLAPLSELVERAGRPGFEDWARGFLTSGRSR